MSEDMSNVNPTWNKPHGGAKVAVIGCGPGGMFVCHAVESERLQLQTLLKEASSEEERTALQEKLDLLPSVICFEQADAPGGVWRSTKNTGTGTAFKTDTNMYEALWCNGPKEVMEFADYTFQEHWNDSKLPVYLPRQAVLDYILTRVTRNCPDFFDKYAHFETRVNTVTYDAATNQFTVQTTHLPTQTVTTALYDKVIWSAGQNGSGKIPGPIKQPFEEARQQFLQHHQTSPESLPPFLHASSMEQRVADQVKDRHLLLIGGSYSAEDLAFMGIKWGAQHITILTRRHGIDVPVCWSTNWPDNKVTVVAGYSVDKVDVVENKSKLSYSVALKKYAYEIDVLEVEELALPKDDGPASSPPLSPNNEAPASPKSVVEAEATVTNSIDNVDVVICCTGYTEHLDMLDKSCYNMTDEALSSYLNAKDIMELPEDWTMPENGLTGIIEKYYKPEEEEEDDDHEEKKTDDLPVSETTTTSVQHIPPKRDNLYPGCYANPYSYRECVFVNNPNLMWLAADNFDAPLLALDVQANLTVKFITGQRKMPTLQEMQAENYKQALLEMSMPMVRYWMDTNYHNAVQRWLAETCRKVHFTDKKGNRCSKYEYPKEWEAAYLQTSRFEQHLLARLMEEADYPLQLGNLHELNERGELFMKVNWECRNNATCPQEGTTFRDVDAAQCATLKSILTGSQPAPLKGRWLDMDDFMENVTDMVS